MKVAKPLQRVIEAFERLPGIGPKSAARLAYYLLHVPQDMLTEFGEAVSLLKKSTVLCERCFNVVESSPCDICTDNTRNYSQVCVVEQPLDLLALEKAGIYKGLYHVLHGAISPLNNIGPDEIKIAELTKRLKNSEVGEVILALNPNMEGEATAMFIRKEIPNGMKVTRLARGLPVGADIEYADEVTLTRALEGRAEY